MVGFFVGELVGGFTGALVVGAEVTGEALFKHA